ncbi:MAG: flagellar biosynthesis anti-sigma factor FlgM [Planctomycetaceae bacterium]|jgi:anti-sigma28 factor (negative regulator of flagellin synthesis)|nr:flagellar biosynthesis anti-sigma factor FlgM [Planctomycetaceae bacterium]
MEINRNQYSQYSQGIQKTRVNQEINRQTTNNQVTPNNAKINQYRDEIKFTGEAIEFNNNSKLESSVSGVRFDLVNKIKAEIAAGNYDTPDKMDIAVDRMMAKLNLF